MKQTTAPTPHPIRAARKARRWSQQELGQRLNPQVGKATVSQWEADQTRPSPDFAVQLVDLFPGLLSLDALYRRQPERADA